MKNKQLKRSNTNKILFGVIGGLAEHFEIDTVLARLIFIALLVITGFFPFGIIYLIAVVVMPEGLNSKDHKKEHVEAKVEEVKTETKEELENKPNIKEEII
jgi:phage shock protein C